MKEIKKISTDHLHWDASCKEAKILTEYHEVPIFECLVTSTNKTGEVRSQFHAVTDSHDQMGSEMEACMNTSEAHGHSLPTDNPQRDKSFFCNAFYLLKNYDNDASINSDASLSGNNTNNVENLAESNVLNDQIKYISTAEDISIFCYAIREEMRKVEPRDGTAGFDCE